MKLTATSTFIPSAELGNFIASTISPAVQRAVDRSVLVVQDRAKQLVPVDTGALRESIDTYVSADAQLITGIISPGRDYAGFVEFGTRFMKAQPYMRPAMDSTRDEVRDIFVSELGAAVNG